MITTTTVADLISQIESSGNPFAYRFEPTVYKNLSTGPLTPAHAKIVANIQQLHKCSQQSAMVIYSSSYGFYQIMGFNLWNPDTLGCQSSFGVFMAGFQTGYFNTLLKYMKLDDMTVEDLATYPKLRNMFAITYNGSTVYAEAIENALKHFNIPVIE